MTFSLFVEWAIDFSFCPPPLCCLLSDCTLASERAHTSFFRELDVDRLWMKSRSCLNIYFADIPIDKNSLAVYFPLSSRYFFCVAKMRETAWGRCWNESLFLILRLQLDFGGKHFPDCPKYDRVSRVDSLCERSMCLYGWVRFHTHPRCLRGHVLTFCRDLTHCCPHLWG